MQPDAWNDYSAQNKSDAEMEMAKSQHLREAIFHLIEQTNNDLAVQIDQTNFDFRKRIYEMKRAKEELEYQMKKVYHKPNKTLDLIFVKCSKTSKCNDIKTGFSDSRRIRCSRALYARFGDCI